MSQTFSYRETSVDLWSGVTAVAAVSLLVLGVGFQNSAAAYCGSLLLIYLLAMCWLSFRWIVLLAAAAAVVALAGCVAITPHGWGVHVTPPKDTYAVFVPFIVLFLVLHLLGAIPLQYIATHVGGDVEQALMPADVIRDGAVTSVWGGVAVTLGLAAWYKYRRAVAAASPTASPAVLDTPRQSAEGRPAV